VYTLCCGLLQNFVMYVFWCNHRPISHRFRDISTYKHSDKPVRPVATLRYEEAVASSFLVVYTFWDTNRCNDWETVKRKKYGRKSRAKEPVNKIRLLICQSAKIDNIQPTARLGAFVPVISAVVVSVAQPLRINAPSTRRITTTLHRPSRTDEICWTSQHASSCQ